MREISREQMQELLSAPIFHQIGETADEIGLECYLVGGYVRDLFLERPSKDIDCVVVGPEGTAKVEKQKAKDEIEVMTLALCPLPIASLLVLPLHKP